MNDKILILLGESSKSIGIGLEIATRRNLVGCSTTTIKLVSIKYLLFTSFRLKKFVNKYRRPELNILYVRRRIYKSLRGAIHIVCQIKKKRAISQFDGVDVLPILKAHFSGISGTDNIDIANMQVFKLVLAAWNALASIEIAYKYLKDRDELIAFNGRGLVESSFIAVARTFGVKTWLTERGASESKYMIYASSPHNNLEWWRNIEEFILDLDDSGKLFEKEVESFLSKKSRGLDMFEKKRWAALMTDPFMPDYGIQGKEYVVFFSVSTGEVSPFLDFMPSLGFTSQIEAFKKLSDICKIENVNIILRRHPNSLGLDGIDREESMWKETLYGQDHVLYIGPKNKANSYEIARGARAVFTWRSTIGVDTLHLKIPSFAMGPAKWARHEEVQAFSADSIRARIQNPGEAFDFAAREFAAYLCNFGEHYRSFKSVDRWGIIDLRNKFIPYNAFHKITSFARKLTKLFTNNRIN